MAEGTTSKKGKAKPPRDYEDDYKQSQHISKEGWNGIPASCFRNALISACRLVGFAMTMAKLSVFVEKDGIDATEGSPLVRIFGKPRQHEMPAKIGFGKTDLRVRAMWEEWHVDLRVRWDADQFTATDVLNLLHRVGLQVGIGEGRPDSPKSAGLGWGLFDVELMEAANV